MATSINNALLGFLSSQADEAAAKRAQTPIKVTPGMVPKAVIDKAAIDKAAHTSRAVTATQQLETGQQALGAELRAALAKAGVKLTGSVEFIVKGDGAVETRGAAADKAAVKAFLASDTAQPSLASRIASQAQQALKTAGSIQQGAAISEAAKLAKSPGAVMSLYSTLMQQAPAASVVFSVSDGGSKLSYPGSLTVSA